MKVKLCDKKALDGDNRISTIIMMAIFIIARGGIELYPTN